MSYWPQSCTFFENKRIISGVRLAYQPSFSCPVGHLWPRDAAHPWTLMVLLHLPGFRWPQIETWRQKKCGEMLETSEKAISTLWCEKIFLFPSKSQVVDAEITAKLDRLTDGPGFSIMASWILDLSASLQESKKCVENNGSPFEEIFTPRRSLVRFYGPYCPCVV